MSLKHDIELFYAKILVITYNRWGQHIVLLLNGVHKAIRHSLPLDYKVVERTETGSWQGRAM